MPDGDDLTGDKKFTGEQKLKNGKGKCNVGEVKLEKTLEKMKMCICRLMVCGN